VREPSPVHVLDDGGGQWWQVDVVLRPPTGAPDVNAALLDLVRAASCDTDDVPPKVRDVHITYSYDMNPPEGNLGVGIWVRAVDVGRAVNAAWSMVAACAAELLDPREPELWDLRALPLSAVLDRDSLPNPHSTTAYRTVPRTP